ncbi:Lipase -like protein [Toxocara canis]|uniref:Lipase-like protein n=1 Tax=Toxocara canis TaxID=6265 RepID=A0A0B2VJ98_TOXCA|nr:Lipase -like protein [Toxocara canis]
MAYNCATSIKAAFHYNETFAMKVALPLMAASAAPDHQTVLPQIIGFAFEKMRGIPVVGGSVDIYYHDAFTKFWKLMEPVVRDATDKYTEAEVWFFGHSLGGGLASIASTVVSAKKMVLASRIKLITFGQPRVTDNLFAQRHDQLVPYSFRIINRHDGFTSMPARLPDNQKTGPFHHRYEVWYPKGMGPGAKFIASAMPEDGFGHESTAAILNVNDHLAMFGKVIGEWWQRECKD